MMASPAYLPLRRRAALAGLAALPAATGTLWLRTPLSQTAGEPHHRPPRPEAAAAAGASARLLASALDGQWRLHEGLARALQPLTADVQPERLRAELDAAGSNASHLVWMGVASTATGRVTAATRGMSEGADVSRSSWFTVGLAGDFAGNVPDAVLLQRALRRDEREEPLRLVDFASPLRDETGQVVAVLGGYLDWLWIRQMLARTSMPEGAHLVLADGMDRVMFGPGFAYTADLQGAPRIPVVQASGMPSLGWSVLVISDPLSS